MMKKINHIILTLCLVLCAGLVQAQEPQLAFLGAEGFGRYAMGARAVATPQVYHVTNLNDSGEGSLRDAVSQPGRVVVFDVCGVIHIKSRLVFSGNSYIAGHTAPGDGIIVYGNGASFSGANNIIVRYMRFYMGAGGESGKDAAGIANGSDMIFDHCSFLWGKDESFSINWDSKGTKPTNITLQHCIVGQGLISHSCGGLIQTEGGVSIIGCLYIDNETRNPKVKGLNQFINNVVYNWGGSNGYILADSDGPSWAWMEGNYFISGPKSGALPFTRARANFQLYAKDNLVDGNKNGVLDGVLATDANYGNTNAGAPPTMVESVTGFAKDNCTTCADIPKPFLPLVESALSAADALERVKTSVGASLPARSEVDAYLIDQLFSYGAEGVHISNEVQNGIYGNVGVVNVGEKSDDNIGGATLAGNGYLEVENYINGINAPAGKPYVRSPRRLDTMSRSTNSIFLKWINQTEDADNIVVEQALDGGSFAVVATLAGDATSYQAIGLEEDTFYEFRIAAKKGALTSTPASLRASTKGEPGCPLESKNLLPANGGTSRYYTSVDFSWTNETGEWSRPILYSVYIGEAENAMTKIADSLTATSFAYTPAAPLEMQKTYYWRVDAHNVVKNEPCTTKGTVWSFKTSACKFTANLVDLGNDFVPEGTALIKAQSGVTFSNKNEQVVFAGTDNEVAFTPKSSVVYQSGNGSYLQAINVPMWQMKAADDYIDVTLGGMSAEKVIAKFIINGTDAVPDGTGRAMPTVCFSDKLEFDPNSILGFEQVTLNICRKVETPAQELTAPEGTKSVRIYQSVKIAEVGGDGAQYKVSADGDEYKSGGQPRIAYLGVRLDLVKCEGEDIVQSANNKLKELSVNGVKATINNIDNTITCRLPFGSKLGNFPVVFTLEDTAATADFITGESHDFSSDLSIELTAENGDKRTYTVSVTIPTKKQLAMLTANGKAEAYDELFISAFDDFDITYLNAGDDAPTDIEAYYADYQLIVLHSNVGGTNAIAVKTREMVGKKPILNMKAYFYQNSGGRWNWSASSGVNAGIGAVSVNVDGSLHSHPIFEEVAFSGDTLTFYGEPTTAQNGIQYTPDFVGGTNWSGLLDSANHTLATYGDAAGIQMHEINLSNAAKFIMVGLSYEGDAYLKFNQNTVTLLRNAADYLANPYVHYDYDNAAIVDDTPSDDATLSSLTVSEGTLTPAFSTNNLSYTVNVENSVSSITLTATANHNGASVSGDGEKPLEVGSNNFEVEVTAEDGSTTKTYTVNVVRTELDPRSNVNTIAALTVNGFVAQQHGDSLICTMSSITSLDSWVVDFILDHDSATADFTSGATHDFAAQNPLTIVVTAENEEQRTYLVFVQAPVSPTAVEKVENLRLWYANGTLYNPDAEKLSIYTSVGVVVLRDSGEPLLNLSRLPAGLYIAKTESGKVIKFVK